MDTQKLLDVIGLYKQKFEKDGIEKETYPHEKHLPLLNLRASALMHCHAMLEKMEDFLAEERNKKTFRWLGFIQGALWVLRIYTLEDLKNHNRPTL